MHELRRPSPFETVALPQWMREELRASNFTGNFLRTNRGSLLIMKVPESIIPELAGVGVTQTHHLYETPVAPVIHVVTAFPVDPEDPILIDAFFDPANKEDRLTYQTMALRDELEIRILDERMEERFVKVAQGLPQDPDISLRLYKAIDMSRRIPKDQYDFDIARELILDFTTV